MGIALKDIRGIKEPAEVSDIGMSLEEFLSLVEGDLFALRVRGNTLRPVIFDGDFIIVRKQDYADFNDVVIAVVEDKACCVFYRDTIKLSLKILGRVVESRRMFKEVSTNE